MVRLALAQVGKSPSPFHLPASVLFLPGPHCFPKTTAAALAICWAVLRREPGERLHT